mgnify:CR=1 FL=1
MASPFCSQLARSHGVSPAGTATEAAHWLLIEDASPWGSHAVEDAEWHGEVRETIETWTEEVPDLRVQLIRRELTTWDTPGRVRCIAVRAGPQPVVHDWSLNAYEDLAAVPVPEVLHASSADRGSGSVRAHLREWPPRCLLCQVGTSRSNCRRRRGFQHCVADVTPWGPSFCPHRTGFAPRHALRLASPRRYGRTDCRSSAGAFVRSRSGPRRGPSASSCAGGMHRAPEAPWASRPPRDPGDLGGGGRRSVDGTRSEERTDRSSPRAAGAAGTPLPSQLRQ